MKFEKSERSESIGGFNLRGRRGERLAKFKNNKNHKTETQTFWCRFRLRARRTGGRGVGAERLKSETVAVLSIFIYHTARRGFGYIEIVERKMIRQPCDACHLPRYAASQTARFTVVITRATTVLIVYVSIEYRSRIGRESRRDR